MEWFRERFSGLGNGLWKDSGNGPGKGSRNGLGMVQKKVWVRVWGMVQEMDQ